MSIDTYQDPMILAARAAAEAERDSGGRLSAGSLFMGCVALASQTEPARSMTPEEGQAIVGGDGIKPSFTDLDDFGVPSDPVKPTEALESD